MLGEGAGGGGLRRFALTQAGGENALDTTVFGDGAAGEGEALLGEDRCDLIIGVGVIWIFCGDQVQERLTDRVGVAKERV